MELKKIKVGFQNSSVEIPYYDTSTGSVSLDSNTSADGPTVFFSAGMHGNEINGVYLLGEFIKWFDENIKEGDLKGNLIIFPVLNPDGFNDKTRLVPQDSKDLNRQFSDEEPKSLSEQIAYDLKHKFFSKCDMGVDLHDSGNYAMYEPHSRIHITDKRDCESCSRNMARIFGTEYILEREGNSGMMAVALNNQFNTPVITIEIGGSQEIHPKLLEVGLQGLKNVLYANRMLEGEIKLPSKQYVISEMLGVRSQESGYIELDVSLGDKVVQGEDIGYIYNPITQKRTRIVSPASGIVFSKWADNQIKYNMKIFSLLPDDGIENNKILELENFSVKNIEL